MRSSIFRAGWREASPEQPYFQELAWHKDSQAPQKLLELEIVGSLSNSREPGDRELRVSALKNLWGRAHARPGLLPMPHRPVLPSQALPGCNHPLGKALPGCSHPLGKVLPPTAPRYLTGNLSAAGGLHAAVQTCGIASAGRPRRDAARSIALIGRPRRGLISPGGSPHASSFKIANFLRLRANQRVLLSFENLLGEEDGNERSK